MSLRFQGQLLAQTGLLASTWLLAMRFLRASLDLKLMFGKRLSFQSMIAAKSRLSMPCMLLNTSATSSCGLDLHQELLLMATKLVAKLKSEREVQQRLADCAPLCALSSVKDAVGKEHS